MPRTGKTPEKPSQRQRQAQSENGQKAQLDAIPVQRMGGEPVRDRSGKPGNEKIGEVHHKEGDNTGCVLVFMPLYILEEKGKGIQESTSLFLMLGINSGRQPLNQKAAA